MTIGEHLRDFAGKPVVDFPHECNFTRRCPDHEPADEDALAEPGRVAWRLRCRHCWGKLAAEFAEAVDTSQVTHLVTGVDFWLSPAELRLPALRALFVGDITWEESELCGIELPDISGLLGAYPGLEHLGVRGSSCGRFDPVRHDALRTLRFESVALSPTMVRAVGDSDLPALERLDLWLGTKEYGGNTTVADLEGILGGARLPSLRHLGLENSEIQDEIAAAVAGAPVMARLTSLSLAMGTLTDRGAEALLASRAPTHLDELDLHHHFLSEPMMERVREALPGVQVNLDDVQVPYEGEDDEYYDEDEDRFYVAVSE